jgi:hypothetical protein
MSELARFSAQTLRCSLMGCALAGFQLLSVSGFAAVEKSILARAKRLATDRMVERPHAKDSEADRTPTKPRAGGHSGHVGAAKYGGRKNHAQSDGHFKRNTAD